jgi:hypothetical protein
MTKEKELGLLAMGFSHTLPSLLGGTPEGLRTPDSSVISFRLENLNYKCEFDIDQYGQVHFVLNASSEGKTIKLNGERKFSNSEIDNTHYLSHRRFTEHPDGSVLVDCRVKRSLPDVDSRNALYADIVRYVIKEVASTTKVSN